MIMNTLFNNNEDMEITPIGKGFGLKKINSNKFILYRQGVPDKELVFYTKLDKQIITVDLVLKHGVIKHRLAEIVGVTRKTIDVWVDTYHQGGNAALVNSSKKGSGRREKQNITRPDGNKFKEYAARKKLASILKEYLPDERDLLPVLDATTKCKGQVKSTENRLIVRLEPLERHQFRNAQEQLCRHLNQMNVKLHNDKTLAFDVGK
ncbi:hypothetical protein ES705_26292 [subsurface metagenome]